MNTLFPKSIIRNRIKKLQKALNKYPAAVACIGSSKSVLRSRDSHYPYSQNNDFLYLTGTPRLEGTILLLSNNPKKSVLIAPPLDKKKQVWDGPQVNPKEVAEILGVNYTESSSVVTEAHKQIEGHETLVFQGEQFTLGAEVLQSILSRPVYSRGNVPSFLIHSDKIIGELRLHKEPFEIECIRQANLLTAETLYSILPLLQSQATEKEIASVFGFSVLEENSNCSFETIVGVGKNAATLHHTPTDTKLTKGAMVLIDCGATYLQYAGDMTRVFPTSGKFSDIQEKLYSAVLHAQKSVIKKTKPGIFFKSLHDTAVRELSYALSDLKIIKKRPAEIIAKGLYKEFFPHGIGHSLGLDVHDVGELRSLGSVKLAAGMVFTVEPGLYSQKKQGIIPPFGIRIEDNIAVTKTGYENLSTCFPKAVKDIEALF